MCAWHPRRWYMRTASTASEKRHMATYMGATAAVHNMAHGLAMFKEDEVVMLVEGRYGGADCSRAEVEIAGTTGHDASKKAQAERGQDQARRLTGLLCTGACCWMLQRDEGRGATSSGSTRAQAHAHPHSSYGTVG